MVNLTRIYTKTGDDGTTSLGDMSRTSKNDLRLIAFADVDEANSALGVVLTCAEIAPEVRSVLLRVQNELFDVGADLCTPVAEAPPIPPLRVEPAYVERLEADIDRFNARPAEAPLVRAARGHGCGSAPARRADHHPSR